MSERVKETSTKKKHQRAAFEKSSKTHRTKQYLKFLCEVTLRKSKTVKGDLTRAAGMANIASQHYADGALVYHLIVSPRSLMHETRMMSEIDLTRQKPESTWLTMALSGRKKYTPSRM